MDEFTRNRLNNTKRALDLDVVDMLRLVIDDIESGRTKCTGAVLVLAYIPENSPWEYESVIAGLASDQVLVTLDLAKDRCKRNWLKL